MLPWSIGMVAAFAIPTTTSEPLSDTGRLGRPEQSVGEADRHTPGLAGRNN